MKLDPDPTLYTKINSNWIKDLNLSPETIKLLEEKTRGKHLDIRRGDHFLDLTLKAKATKAKVKKRDYTN